MSKKNKYVLFEITPEIEHFAELCEKNTTIDKELYAKYEVKRGLRDLNGSCRFDKHFRCVCYQSCRWKRGSVRR